MKYIIWDWNGTLLDDVALCIDVMNGMLRRRGLSPLTPGRYREIFTFPVENYYRAAGLDLESEPFTALAAEYISEFDRRVMDCGLRPGTIEALERLKGAGYAQLIVSASQRSALARQVESRGLVHPVKGAVKEFSIADNIVKKKLPDHRNWSDYICLFL